MEFINVFLLTGAICLIGQIILDNTKLTTGHITTTFTVIGAVLAFLGIYDYLADYSLIGSSVLITNFGNLLYNACLDGYYQNGILGMFTNILSTTGGGITASIIFASTLTLFSESKD